MTALPVDGASGWGDTLNAYLTSLSASVAGNTTSIANHASNNPADPHGDRAFTTGLVNPITTGVNGPNGYVKANSSGFIPSALISGSATTGGIYSGVYDAVTMFGAVAGNGLDQSTALQNALNAAGTAGGGIVYIGPGTFSISNYLIMPSNVWLLMNPGTKLQRIPGSVNAPYMITNVQFGTSNPPSTNVKITGGTVNSYGSGVSSACTNILLVQGSQSMIEGVHFFSPFAAGPAIEVNGCSQTYISRCNFDGNAGAGVSSVPAVRVNTTSTSTSPASLPGVSYNNAAVAGLHVDSCTTAALSGGPNGPFGSLVGSDKVSISFNVHSYIVVSGCTTFYASNNSPIFMNTAIWNSSTWANNAWFEFSGVWNTITLDGGWSTSGSFPIPQYRLTADGNLQLSGFATKGTNFTSNQTLNSSHPLPALYRPANAHHYRAWDNSTGTARSGIQIDNTGVITVFGSSGFPGQQAEIEGLISLL
jgi:Pectate lyase superfamily protein